MPSRRKTASTTKVPIASPVKTITPSAGETGSGAGLSSDRTLHGWPVWRAQKPGRRARHARLRRTMRQSWPFGGTWGTSPRSLRRLSRRVIGGLARRFVGVIAGRIEGARHAVLPEAHLLDELELAGEERPDRLAAVDAPDRLPEEWSDRDRGDLGQALVGRKGDRVREDYLADARLPDSLDGRLREHAVGGAGEDLADSFVLQRADDLDERAGRIDLVVDDDRLARADLADDVEQLRPVEVADESIGR